MPPLPSPRPPLFALLFVSIFGFIGLTVLGFLWGSSGFHEPPLFFKLFGSLIALAFVIFGFGLPLNALRKREEPPGGTGTGSATGSPPSGGYRCPACGAALATEEVSPLGDVKCSYCKKWFNIHSSQ